MGEDRPVPIPCAIPPPTSKGHLNPRGSSLIPVATQEAAYFPRAAHVTHSEAAHVEARFPVANHSPQWLTWPSAPTNNRVTACFPMATSLPRLSTPCDHTRAAHTPRSLTLPAPPMLPNPQGMPSPSPRGSHT